MTFAQRANPLPGQIHGCCQSSEALASGSDSASAERRGWAGTEEKIVVAVDFRNGMSDGALDCSFVFGSNQVII
jgi:hypothetical protein